MSARRITVNTVWLLMGRLARLGTVFLVVTWTARYLGPVDFGVYSYTIAFVLLLAQFGSMGLAGIVTRDLVEDPHNGRTILGTAFGLRLLGTVATVATIATVAQLLPQPDPRVRWMILVFAVGYMFHPAAVIESFYEARVQSGLSVIARIVASVALLGMTALLIRWTAPLGWFVAARAVDVAFVGITLVAILALHRRQALRWRFDRAVAAQMLRRSWPLLASAVTATIYLRIDQVMLGVMSSARDVGIYAAASQLSEVWYFLPTILMSSLFPLLISLKQHDNRAYQEHLRSIFGALGWIGITLAILVALSATQLVSTIFGEGFEDSTAVLRIHVWAMPFIFMRAALSKWIIIENVYIVSLFTHGAGAITNVAMNLVLIPSFGPRGAAIATVASYAVASYLSLFVNPRTRPIAREMTVSVMLPHRHAAKLLGRRD